MSACDEYSIPCPVCGESLVAFGEIAIHGGVLAARDPEGKDRLDIFLKCGDCEQEFTTYIAVDSLIPVDGAEVRG